MRMRRTRYQVHLLHTALDPLNGLRQFNPSWCYPNRLPACSSVHKVGVMPRAYLAIPTRRHRKPCQHSTNGRFARGGLSYDA